MIFFNPHFCYSILVYSRYRFYDFTSWIRTQDAAHKADPCGSDYVTLVTVSPTLNHLISIPREVKYKCSSAFLLYCTLSRVNAHWIIWHGGGSKVTLSLQYRRIQFVENSNCILSDELMFIWKVIFPNIYSCSFLNDL